jgi:hypothetical protein
MPAGHYPASMNERPEEIRAAIERAVAERDNPKNPIGARCAAGNFVLCRRAELALLASKN